MQRCMSMQGRKQGDRHHLGLCRQPASPLLSCPLLLQLQPTPQAPPLLLPPPPPTRSMSQSPRTVKLSLTLQVRPLTHPLIMLITNSARLCPPPRLHSALTRQCPFQHQGGLRMHKLALLAGPSLQKPRLYQSSLAASSPFSIGHKV